MSASTASSGPEKKGERQGRQPRNAVLGDDELIRDVLSNHKPSSNPVIRLVWIVVGSVFVVFAGIGVVLPGWPTTSWLVAAAYCYGRSSQRLFRWLLTNRVFGSLLLGYYRNDRALPLHSKVAICTLIAAVSVASIWYITLLGDPGFGQATVAIVALIGIGWVGWKVPTFR
jgi:uncharacterized membrane protein YbaN (DUF454 family)